jgi:hypothetical protein
MRNTVVIARLTVTNRPLRMSRYAPMFPWGEYTKRCASRARVESGTDS